MSERIAPEEFNIDWLKDIRAQVRSASILQAAADKQKNIALTVKDKSGKILYRWSFIGEQLSDSSREMKELNLAVSVVPVASAEGLSTDRFGKEGLVLQFSQEGNLPAMAQVRVYVGDLVGGTAASGLDRNKKIYLYHYNKDTGKLETLPHSSDYTIDKDGYITILLVHCSDYIILPKAADSSAMTTLRKQITVSLDKTNLSLKGKEKTAAILVQLPSTLELVKNRKDKTANEAVGAVTVTFKSGNEKVIKVDENGKITAVGKGKATITVKVELYSGKISTYYFKVTVK